MVKTDEHILYSQHYIAGSRNKILPIFLLGCSLPFLTGVALEESEFLRLNNDIPDLTTRPSLLFIASQTGSRE